MTELDARDQADVLILGGSFLGVELVRQLRRSWRGRKLRITVVDRQRAHPYIPLGHELLAERMPTSVDASTILDTAAYVAARGPSRFIEGEIVRFDPDQHRVELADGRSISARFVVIALGSIVDPPPSLPGAERLVSYKLQAGFDQCREALERNLIEGEARASTERPQVVVVGGGITGVEIAGELAHLASSSKAPSRWRAPKVTVIQAADRLLPGLHPRAGRRALAALRAQGAEVELETRLVALDGQRAVVVGPRGERELPCDLGFWAGGVRPPAVIARLGLPLTEDGWLRVGPTLQCMPSSTREPELFAGGDIARVYGGHGRWPSMQRAIESIFAGQAIAANILTLAKHPAGYRRKGVPPLEPHELWTDFPHGVSVGARSLLVYGRLVVPLAAANIWFRRFLMRRYMARYRP